VKFQKRTHHKFSLFLCATSQHSSLFEEVILEQTVYVQSSLILSIALTLRAKHRGSANVQAETSRQMCVCGAGIRKPRFPAAVQNRLK
jgi:hypothetical protein